MGCCLVALVLAGAPRVAVIMWWFFEPARVNTSFETIIWPLLGLVFAPWTTLAWVFVYPGGITTLDWLWLVIAVAIDVGTHLGNGESGRRYYYTS